MENALNRALGAIFVKLLDKLLLTMYSIKSKSRLNKRTQLLRKIFEGKVDTMDPKQEVIAPADTSEAAYYANIIQFIPHLIYGRDKSGTYTVVNQAFADFAGMAINEIIGKNDKELMIFLNPDQIKMTDEARVFTTYRSSKISKSTFPTPIAAMFPLKQKHQENALSYI
jgi:PAS domain-containing protein